MCTRPISHLGNIFACRTCDECIATRRHGWVARAMAEKAMWPHALCLALTYSDETQEGRDGARMFQYADVRAFLKRLRSAIKRQDETAQLRFLCAGEQGTRNGRCHWHLILYSNVDLTGIGTFRGRYGVVVERADMMTVGKRKIRLNWSMWPLGFVTLQEPDQGGMSYVLSYCLKDQFTAEKSRDTMREAKSENFATGLFRMSKRPPIGQAWLMQKLDGLAERGAVLPNTNLKIPGFSGYWHPNGTFRETLLWGLVALNQRVKWATGANAPQWSSLLASCKDSEKDMEILDGQGPPPEEHPEHPDYQSAEYEFDRRQREHIEERKRADFARACGSELPCRDCLHYLDDGTLDDLGVTRIWPDLQAEDQSWHYGPLPGFEGVTQRQNRSAGRLNPHCRARSLELARLVFPGSAPDGSGRNNSGNIA